MTFERSQFPLLALSLIGFSAHVLIGHFVFKHEVNSANKAMGGSGHRLSGTKNGPFATIESTKGRVTAGQGSSSLTESLPGAIMGFESARTKDFTAGNIIARSQTEPGSKLYDEGETGHIGADFREDGLSQIGGVGWYTQLEFE